MKVRPQPGFTTGRRRSYQGDTPKNPDAIIFHSGTNDITNDKPTKNKIKIFKLIEDTYTDIQVIISGSITERITT